MFVFQKFLQRANKECQRSKYWVGLPTRSSFYKFFQKIPRIWLICGNHLFHNIFKVVDPKIFKIQFNLLQNSLGRYMIRCKQKLVNLIDFRNSSLDPVELKLSLPPTAGHAVRVGRVFTTTTISTRHISENYRLQFNFNLGRESASNILLNPINIV